MNLLIRPIWSWPNPPITCLSGICTRNSAGKLIGHASLVKVIRHSGLFYSKKKQRWETDGSENWRPSAMPLHNKQRSVFVIATDQNGRGLFEAAHRHLSRRHHWRWNRNCQENGSAESKFVEKDIHWLSLPHPNEVLVFSSNELPFRIIRRASWNQPIIAFPSQLGWRAKNMNTFSK